MVLTDSIEAEGQTPTVPGRPAPTSRSFDEASKTRRRRRQGTVVESGLGSGFRVRGSESRVLGFRV